jgi:MFS family permease
MVPSMGLLNSLGTLHAWTSSYQLTDYSESDIGWIYGAYAFFLYVAGAQAGPIFDCYGPLYVVVPGSIGMVASLLCFSFSTGTSSISPLDIGHEALADFRSQSTTKSSSRSVSSGASQPVPSSTRPSQ